ncbi:hypothetical protein QTP88_028148 [Uroleucon formosanum]
MDIQEIDQNKFSKVTQTFSNVIPGGSTFGGATSKIECNNNGNFLLALELLAEFDPFLSNHLETYENPGKEVKASRHFSISVDSTPDISLINQPSLCVRYVNNKGKPVERFLCYLDKIGHTSNCSLKKRSFNVLWVAKFKKILKMGRTIKSLGTSELGYQVWPKTAAQHGLNGHYRDAISNYQTLNSGIFLHTASRKRRKASIQYSFVMVCPFGSFPH